MAAVVTLEMTVAGFAVAVVVGLPLVGLRLFAPRAASALAIGFIELLRGTPLLVQLFFLFFVLPLWGINLPAFGIAVLALGLHYGAYCAEVYRGGIESVPRGQWEAFTALGLRPLVGFFRIILPQALVPVAPALGNYLIALFKETPILSTIAIAELLQRAKEIGSETFRYTEPITLVGLFFLAMSLVSASAIRALERRLKRSPN